MWNMLNYIMIVSIFIVGYSLFNLKSEVNILAYQLSHINQQIEEEVETINVLKAEYSHLRSPVKLQKLVSRYLPLKAITPVQVTNDLLLLNKNNNSSELGVSTSKVNNKTYKTQHKKTVNIQSNKKKRSER